MSAHLFVRQTKFVTVAQANRCAGVIVAILKNGRHTFNAQRDWWDSLSCEKRGFVWLPLPGQWKPEGIVEACRFLGKVGGSSLVLNVEPRSPKDKPRWEDGHRQEAATYVARCREAADEHGLDLGFTSWARPSARTRFPWAEFIQGTDFSIPQPYEVHGRTGRAYVDSCLAEWAAHGAEHQWLGRGAHELDRSDDDAWRTPEEIAQHRESTPRGMTEAWWLPAGRLPGSVLDAILADRDLATADTDPAWDPTRILALAEEAKAAGDLPRARALRAAFDAKG